MYGYFLDSFWGGLSSRVPFEVSSAVQLVVCMGECTDIFWIRLARCLLRCVCCSSGGVGLVYGDFWIRFGGGCLEVPSAVQVVVYG